MSPGGGNRVLVVGQGYVGLPLALRAVEVGFDVTGFDVDDARVGSLQQGRSHIGDVTDDQVAAALAIGRYPATSLLGDLHLGLGDVRAGFLPMPGGGPRLTWRALADPGPPPLPNWDFQLGDIELF